MDSFLQGQQAPPKLPDPRRALPQPREQTWEQPQALSQSLEQPRALPQLPEQPQALPRQSAKEYQLAEPEAVSAWCRLQSSAVI
jgi:hypothetical protein